MRQLLYSFFVFFCCISSLTAFEIAGKPFDLEADFVFFDQETGDIQASQNVWVKIDEYIIRADRFNYDASLTVLSLEKNVSVSFRDLNLLVSNIDYNISLDSGTAKDLSFTVDDLYVDASEAKLEPDSITFLTINYSKCSLDSHRHYQFTSKELVYHRDVQVVKSRDNAFYFYNRRFFTYPLYVHRLTQSSNSSVVSVLPKFGRNRVDGDYAQLSFPYYLSNQSFGQTHLFSSQKRGFMAGFSHHQLFGPYHELMLRSFYFFNAQDPDFGLDYFFYFNQFLTDDPIDQFFGEMNQNSNRAYFKLSLQENSIENDTFVTKSPELSLVLPFNYYTVSNRLVFGAGLFTENQTKAFRNQISLNSDINLLQTSVFSFGLGHDFDAMYYKERVFGESALANWNSSGYLNYWKAMMLRMMVQFDIPILKTFSFHYMYYNEGQSIFEFDSFNRPTDSELFVELDIPVAQFRFNIKGYYEVEPEKFRSIRLETFYKVHCWNLYLANDFVKDFISLGISF